MNNKSLCCNADTRIGYYSDGTYDGVTVGKIGTYCTKCNNTCNYVYDGKFYQKDGSELDIKIVRKYNLNKINNG